MDLKGLKFDDQGLIPAVVQDWRDGSVLMLGFMNRGAVQKTIESKRVHFWSRSRRKLWEKGETSGHTLHVKHVFLDCDGDTLLVKAEPVGPTCHTGAPSCFFSRLDSGNDLDTMSSDAKGGILESIARTIEERRAHPQADSYVSKLLQGGSDRILKKIVEEAGEVVLSAKNKDREEIVYETADLIFHILVALGAHDIRLDEVYRELAKRHGKSGLRIAGEGTSP